MMIANAFLGFVLSLLLFTKNACAYDMSTFPQLLNQHLFGDTTAGLSVAQIFITIITLICVDSPMLVFQTNVALILVIDFLIVCGYTAIGWCPVFVLLSLLLLIGGLWGIGIIGPVVSGGKNG